MNGVASVAFGLELTEWFVILGGVYALAELAGLSRSSRTIRRQNTDVLERNKMLEGEVERLKARVQQLEMTDQAAVLAAFRQHETGAEARHAQTIQVLSHIHDTLRERSTT